MTASGTSIGLGQGTLAPFAYIRFCVENPDDCASSGGAATVSFTKVMSRLITRINAAVNAGMIPKNDPVGDAWDADVAVGDCEDYVLTKRRKLVAAGVPASALRIAIGRIPSGEGHAVLVVSTDRGEMVLDNRFDKVAEWRSSDVRFLKIQSSGNPKVWFEVRSRRS